MSIFDSVIGSTSSFSDALGGLLSASGLGEPTSKGRSSVDVSSISSILQRGQMTNPYTQGREFEASKSKPAQQVDADSINQQWLQRLSKYTSIPQVQGAKAK